jgi:hypothetical protein
MQRQAAILVDVACVAAARDVEAAGGGPPS